MIHAQTVSHTTRYDEQWGMAQWHITKMLQDRKGFMWFSTWNGLTRFDGYEYVTFKTHAGDGCPVTTDRIRDIELAPNDNIYCMFDEVWYLFNRQTGRFSPLPNALNKQLINKHTSPKSYNNRKTLDGENVKRQMRDRQGNLWTLTEQAIIKQTSYHTPCQSFALFKPAQARCFMVEREAHHYWVATKNDKALRRYSADNRLDGYLTPQGMLSTAPTMFSSAVYTMCQLKDGSILLGSKPDGIFHLTPQDHAQSYQINKITLGSEKANSVYDIRQDHDGRIWIATFHGIFYMNHSGDTPKSIQQTAAWRVRYIHLSRDGKAMMVATTTGLAIAPMPQKGEESQMRFTLHSREPNRAESLSNSATMDICETDNGRIFVSTESGGINEFSIRQRFDHSINFKHYDMMSGFDSDVALSLTIVGQKLLVVGGNVISTLDLQSGW